MQKKPGEIPPPSIPEIKPGQDIPAPIIEPELPPKLVPVEKPDEEPKPEIEPGKELE